jgi:hypothetical protein
LWSYNRELLDLYIDGGSTGTKMGVKGLLFEHCKRVWDGFLRAPDSMLQRGGPNGGSQAFYTTVAVDIWEVTH